MGFITQAKEPTIKSIVLKTIEKILDLSAEEFRGGYQERIYSGNTFTDKYIPDSRKKIIQVIEYLCSLVKPRFDKTMKEKYRSIMERQEKNYNDFANKNNEQYIINKLNLMRELFDDINEFFERMNYFKGEIYREGDEEEDV